MKPILLFDDEREILELCQRILEASGFEIAPYVNMEEAREEILRAPEKYSMVISDWRIGQSATAVPLVSECARQKLPVMIRTNDEDGPWITKAIAAISAELELEEPEKLLDCFPIEIYPLVRGFRDLKYMNLVEDVTEFANRHRATGTPEEER